MATEGEPPQGGHELDFGSGSKDPTPPPVPPVPTEGEAGNPASASPVVPEQVPPAPEQAFPPPGQPSPVQPYGVQPGQPGQPYAAQPAQPYPGQPAQPHTGQQGQPYAGQPYGAQPGQPYGAQPTQPYPGQAAQPYSGQPYGAQPGQAAQPGQPYGAQPTQPYPGQPYGAQPTQPYPGQGDGTQPPKKSSKGLLWGLIGGGAALLIVAILVVALLVVPALTRSSVTAADTVKAYLTAVSKGDAKAALGYLESVPDKKLLTDPVLKASEKLGGVSHISVKKGGESKYSATVAASFEVGGRTVSTTYEAYKDKDTWKIANGVTPISLDSLRGLDATFNGVPTADITDAYVFPGTYEIALDSKYFSIDGDSTFAIASYDDASALYDVRTKLNDAGVSEFRSLVRSSVEACVAMKTLSTPCGMDITAIDLSGASPVEGTVTRTLTADGSAKLDALQPESNGSSPTVVSAYDYISVDMQLQGSDGQTYTVTFGGSLGTPTVDFGKAAPQVTWE
ncbi:hypothetical protein LXM50_10405 [Microbacterium sp. Au-Mic1]|uniref:hypothetical protein n=1 Tax=Microbacterium sp. Au-Mic1 TaxID=2906457 RepID=UPI001E65A285|nr:hypothetical protein [Microbacterium sp. Au-Mic1]MCE4026381.1 hypothetical protein [Microbacterium sp. Au-Mic1]